MFSKNLKKERIKRNMSQSELAERAGITQAHVSYMEMNQKEPTLGIAKRLADALEVPIDKLIS